LKKANKKNKLPHLV